MNIKIPIVPDYLRPNFKMIEQTVLSTLKAINPDKDWQAMVNIENNEIIVTIIEGK